MFHAQSTSTLICGQLCRAKGLLRTNPVNMPDTTRKRFCYGHYVQRAARIGPDRICRIQLPASVSAPFFFQRRHGLCKTDPDPIRMAWSGFVQTHLVWKQAGVQESSGPVSGSTQPVHYQFPTFRLSSVHPQTSQIILCKISLGPI